MARVRKVLRWKKFDDHAIVYVQTEHGDEEYSIYIGGEVETYHHRGINKAFVRRSNEASGVGINDTGVDNTSDSSTRPQSKSNNSRGF